VIDLDFRRATPGDVAAVVALVESAYRGEVSRAGWTTEADLLDGRRTGPDEVGPALADPDVRIVLAEADGALVGSVRIERHDDVAHVGMVAVRPDRQDRGIGRRLLAEAERVARDELGCRRGEMTVILQREPLIAWYGRRGWTPSGRLEPFPYGDERFGRPRRDDLAFVVLTKPW
jgi:GNAT superfamily N-acetyltransferase